MDNTIKVEVFGGTCANSCATCGGSCGTGGSGPELEKEADQLAADLHGQYGDKVEVRYIDTERVGLANYPLVSRTLQAGYNFPMVAVNGKPRLAGGIDLKSVREVLEELMNSN
ncbi:MAG: hypothetical protein ABRQ26_09325 [Syntrophomonadaceae bacterium]